MKKVLLILTVVVIMVQFCIVSNAENYPAFLTENTYDIEENIDENGVPHYIFKPKTNYYYNVSFPYNDYIDNYFTLEGFTRKTGGSSGLHFNMSIPPNLISSNTYFYYDNYQTAIRNIEVGYFQTIVDDDLLNFKREVDSVRLGYNNETDKLKVSFSDNFVDFASMDSLTIANSYVEQDYLSYSKSELLDLGIPAYLYRNMTYKTNSRHPKRIVNATLYKPYYVNCYYYLNGSLASVLKEKAINLKSYIYNKFSDVECVVKDLKASSEKVPVKTTYGTGNLLRDSLRFISSDKFSYRETIKMFNSANISFQGNSVVTSERYKQIHSSITGNRPVYVKIDENTFINVEYPFYQIERAEYNSNGSFKFEYGDSRCNINLLTENVEFEDTGEIYDINTEKFGKPSNLKIFNQGETQVVSDVLMEAVEYNGIIYHTGRLLCVDNFEISETSGITFDNPELSFTSSTNLAFYVTCHENGEKSIDIQYKQGVGNCIMLNKEFLDDSGLKSYIKSNTATIIAGKYQVDLVALQKLFSGEYNLEHFALDNDQVLAVNTINKELSRISNDKKLKTVRVSLIIMGVLCIIYVLLLFTAYILDKSGGVFGVEILPKLTFNNMKVEFSTQVNEDGEFIVNGEVKKKIVSIIVLLSILGVLCVSGLMYGVIIQNLINLYNGVMGR